MIAIVPVHIISTCYTDRIESFTILLTQLMKIA